MILEHLFSVKPERKIFMAEKERNIGRRSPIEEVGELGGQVKAQVDWLTTQVYGFKVEDLIRMIGRADDGCEQDC